MLTQQNGAIYEGNLSTYSQNCGIGQSNWTGDTLPQVMNTGTLTCTPYFQPYYYWQSYPVYVCTDKTKKAIEVLKALQAEKLLKCDSVSRFIELVEKIAGLL